MWNVRYSNSICNQAQKISEQIMHIERVISIKGKINNTCPLKPKFLKTKLKKFEMEEETQEKINYENKNLLMKIMDVEVKPSKYSNEIYAPLDCPAFNKEKMVERRLNREMENYKSNLTFYTKIAKVKPTYHMKTITKSGSYYGTISKRIEKPNRVINPCLYFKSPTYFKNTMERIKREKKNASRIEKGVHSVIIDKRNKDKL